MGKFAYQARNKTGATTQGEIDANNETEVRVKLRAMGLEASRVISKTQVTGADRKASCRERVSLVV